MFCRWNIFLLYFSYNSYKSCPSREWSNSFACIHTKPHLVAGINCDPLSQNWAQPAFTKSWHVHHTCTQGQYGLGPWYLPTLSIPTFSIPTFSIPIPTLSIPIPTLSIPTLSIPTLSIPTLSILTLSIPIWSMLTKCSQTEGFSVADFDLDSFGAPPTVLLASCIVAGWFCSTVAIWKIVGSLLVHTIRIDTHMLTANIMTLSVSTPVHFFSQKQVGSSKCQKFAPVENFALYDMSRTISESEAYYSVLHLQNWSYKTFPEHIANIWTHQSNSCSILSTICTVQKQYITLQN